MGRTTSGFSIAARGRWPPTSNSSSSTRRGRCAARRPPLSSRLIRPGICLGTGAIMPEGPAMSGSIKHGLAIDHKGNVWIGGGTGGDSHLLKFTMEGKFLMQVGKRNARLVSGGSADRAQEQPGDGRGRGPARVYKANSLDMESFGRPAKLVVDPKTNEAFVADGYLNTRIVVMDADTGKFKRFWGAYGNKPDDNMFEK